MAQKQPIRTQHRQPAEEYYLRAFLSFAWNIACRESALERSIDHEERLFDGMARLAALDLLFHLLGRSATESEIEQVVSFSTDDDPPSSLTVVSA